MSVIIKLDTVINQPAYVWVTHRHTLLKSKHVIHALKSNGFQDL